MNERTKVREIINQLRTGPRIATRDVIITSLPLVDEPEGTYIIKISDTLALKWAKELEELLDAE